MSMALMPAHVRLRRVETWVMSSARRKCIDEGGDGLGITGVHPGFADADEAHVGRHEGQQRALHGPDEAWVSERAVERFLEEPGADVDDFHGEVPVARPMASSLAFER
jgi:hypothetical protein